MKETSEPLSEGLQPIIRGCIRRERSAQTQLYKLYSHKMMSICMWYAKNREEAEEILQDGFIRVFTYIHNYTGKGSLEGWIRRIMVNAALSKLQNKKCKALHIVEYDAGVHDVVQQAMFVSQLDEKELLRLIQRLPPVYRVVFNLFVMEGWKHKKIAALLGISEGTSKSNLADARHILQKKIIQLQKDTASSIETYE